MSNIKGQLRTSNSNIPKSAPVSRTSSKDSNISSSNNFSLRTSADLSKSPGDSFVKYNVPCRYYKFGTCKLGDQCRFLHSDKPDDKLRKSRASVDDDDNLSSSPPADSFLSSSPQSIGSDISDQSPFTFKPVPHHIKYRYARRPFIHVVVLFAGDPRVTKYAKDIQNGFLDNGIDVYLQSKIESSGQYIKTENLAEIVTNSKSDQVVVLGDRNMKNHTCQAKRKGKLVEMRLDEIVDVVWSDWPDLDHNKSDLDGKSPTEIADLVHKMSDDQIYHMFEKFCNLRHVKERLDKLEKAIDELKEWKFPSQSPESALSRLVLDSQSSMFDEKMASKLTNTQKTMIRLHQQLIEAEDTLAAVSIESQRTVGNSGRGNIVGTSYTPVELKAGGNGTIPRLTKLGISPILKDKLMIELDLILERVQDMGDDLETLGTPLWTAYRQEYIKNKRKTENNKSPIKTEGSWDCFSCTYTNSPDSSICEVCQHPKKDSKEEDEWSLTGAAGKKQRKQRAQAQKEELEVKKPVKIEKKLSKSIDRPPGFGVKVTPPVSSTQVPWKSVSLDKPKVEPIARPIATPQYDNNYPPLGKKNDLPSIVAEEIEENNDFLNSSLFNASVWLDNKNNGYNSTAQDLYNNGNPWMSAFAPNNNFSLSSLYNSSQQQQQPSVSPANTFYSGGQSPFFTSPGSSYSRGPSSFSSSPTFNNQFSLRNSGNFVQQPPPPQPEKPLFTPQTQFLNIQRPCCYCGEESYLECNNCAKYGMATYFCSPEHQSLVWKDHLDYHRTNDLPYNKF